MAYYFFVKEGQQFGPVSKEKLMEENISPQTLVWSEGMEEWQAAINVKDLEFIFAASSPSVPPPIVNDTNYAPRQNPGFSNTNTKRIRPKTWLVESLLATFFCCMPLGIVSLIYAIKVNDYYTLEDYEEADNASNSAKKWFIASLIVGILTIPLVFFIYAIR